MTQLFPTEPTEISAPHMPLLAQLNAQQLAAVTLPSEHALILAGAGSGKTRVLTTRIAWLVQTQQTSAYGVLAVTFTNKAAREMKTRLSVLLPVNVNAMWIGTFHGLCNRMLRAHYKLVNLPATFQILDTQDQLSAIKRLFKQHQVDEDLYPPKKIQWFIANCKEEGLRPHDVPVRDSQSAKKAELYQLYEEQCQREGVVDFGELMLRSFELLRDHEHVRAHYQQRFKHILVDEFQDTNKLQYAWLKQLCGSDNALMAVGDDDQSIYAFRGARVGNMHDFVHEFHVKHQIKLEQNYRSHGHILDCANELIQHNSTRLGKNLHTEQGAGEPVRVREAPSDWEEAQWLVQEIQHLLHDEDAQGVKLSAHEIAVLYRSNAQSRVIETTLFNAGIAYRVYGGMRFFERAEIKHALAYLRLLENPRDDTSFLRVVNFPPRGIGARTLEQLQDNARAAGCALVDAVSLSGGKAGSNLCAFVAKIDVLREHCTGKTLREIVELMLEHSGLVQHYQVDKDGQERLENLDELVNAAHSFVVQEGFGAEAVATSDDTPKLPIAAEEDSGETMSPLAAFLTHAALEAGDHQAQAGQAAVQLMTVHAAKGLEFDVVFLSGLEEGLFPHENSLGDRQGLEEERRLMYVAITRARQRLYLSYAQSRILHGSTRYNISSRFVDELPEHCLKWLSSRRKSGMGTSTLSSTSAVSMPPTVSRPGSSNARDTHGLRVGMEVFHNKFGQGKVLTLEGQGEQARAQINFPRHGTKWLALSVAKLTPIES